MQHRAKLSKNKLLILVVMSVAAIISMIAAPDGAVNSMFARAAVSVSGSSNLKLSSPKEVPPLAFLGSETKGKVVVVNFWAMWCPSCKIEKPKLNRLAGDFAKEGLIVLSPVDGNDALPAVKQYYTNTGIQNIQPLQDENNAAFRTLDLHGVPTTVILNREGKEIARAEGAVDWDAPAVREFIEKTLREGRN